MVAFEKRRRAHTAIDFEARRESLNMYVHHTPWRIREQAALHVPHLFLKYSEMVPIKELTSGALRIVHLFKATVDIVQLPDEDLRRRA